MSDAYRSFGFQPLAEGSPWWEELALAVVKAKAPKPPTADGGPGTGALLVMITRRLAPHCSACGAELKFAVFADLATPEWVVESRCHGAHEERRVDRFMATGAGIHKIRLLDELSRPWFDAVRDDPHWKGWQP